MLGAKTNENEKIFVLCKPVQWLRFWSVSIWKLFSVWKSCVDPKTSFNLRHVTPSYLTYWHQIMKIQESNRNRIILRENELIDQILYLSCIVVDCTDTFPGQFIFPTWSHRNFVKPSLKHYTDKLGYDLPCLLCVMIHTCDDQQPWFFFSAFLCCVTQSIADFVFCLCI